MLIRYHITLCIEAESLDDAETQAEGIADETEATIVDVRLHESAEAPTVVVCGWHDE